MENFVKYVIGIFILFLGIPIGSLLAKYTKDERKAGQRWFKLIIIISFIGAIVSAILQNDVLFFGFLFIAIVTSKSLRK